MSNQIIADKWFVAFNSHDLEALLELYDENAVHYSPKLKIKQPETNGYIKGKEALRMWWKDAFERLPNLRYEPFRFTSEVDRIFMEYIRYVPGEDEMQVAEILEIREGKIVASKVYHG